MKMRLFPLLALLLILPLHPDPLVNLEPAATIILVNSLADTINSSDGQCTLREAVIAANTNTASGEICTGECDAGTPTDDYIILQPGTYTLTRAGAGEDYTDTGDLDVWENMEIKVGVGSAVIDADQLDRIFDVHANVELALRDLTLRNGYISQAHTGGGALRLNHADAYAEIVYCIFEDNQVDPTQANSAGGAIGAWSSSDFSIGSSIFRRNVANHGGAIYVLGGTGGILKSLFLENESTDMGGAIAGSGELIIENCTFSNNVAGTLGGAIISHFDTLWLNFNTIINNTCQTGGAGIHIQPNTNLWAKGNLVGYNYADDTLPLENNCQIFGTVVFNLFNMESADTCDFTYSNQQLKLGALKDNGGFSWTYALDYDSPAIDAFYSAECPSFDQRSLYRPQDGDNDGVSICDIGAYEKLKDYVFLPLLLR
jgi:CSLREA domain-containing protein